MLGALRISVVLMTMALFAGGAVAGQQSDALTGVWETEGGKSRVHIHGCGETGKLCGTLIWTRNGDLSKIGIRILSGFSFDSEKEHWSGGEIVDPRSGKDYRAYLVPQADNLLEVEGCWFIFCGGQTWNRIPARTVDVRFDRVGTDSDKGAPAED